MSSSLLLSDLSARGEMLSNSALVNSHEHLDRLERWVPKTDTF